MVVPTPEVDDAVLLAMVRCALHAGPLIDHVLDPVTEIGQPSACELAAVEACGRAAWAWRSVDEELCALLCRSGRRHRRR